MNAPQQIQDLVSEAVHAYPAAQIELDPLPSGVCFLWITMNGHSYALEYHPSEGVGISEILPQTVPFAGHDRFFPVLDEAITFYKQLLAGADQAVTGPFHRTAYNQLVHLKSH